MSSLGLHALFLVVVLLALPPPFARVRPPDGIMVDLIGPKTLASLTPPREAAPPEPAIVAPQRIPPAIPSPAETGDRIALPLLPLAHATAILSAGALDRVARTSLGALEGDARFEQLCNIEAMEQIARSDARHEPERAVAYAAADTRMEGDTLIADGAAFLSKGHWYHLRFRCSGTHDHRRVIAFDFAAGEQFPDGDPALPTGVGDD